MELSTIGEPLGSRDAWWSGLNPGYNRARGQSLSTPAKRLQRRTAEFRTNLNYNLIMHRRLVVEESGLLVSREFSRLLDAETDEGESGYQDFLASHVIIPAMRTSVTSFSELADIMIKNHNYQDLGPELLQSSALRLDDLRPAVAFTTTEQNRELMHALVEAKYLSIDTWHEIGLNEAVARGLIKYVPAATAGNKSDYYRASEFWQFADQLDKRRMFAQAQKIRTQITTLSLGVMATNLNLHTIFPAAYAECVARVYGTHLPWTKTQDGKVAIPTSSISDSELTKVQGDVRFLAGSLTPSRIWEIRSSGEFETFLSRLADADKKASEEGSANLLDAMREYYRYIETFVGSRLIGEMEEWRRLRSVDRWITSRAKPTSIASGLISNVVSVSAAVANIPQVSASENVAITVAPLLMSACLYLFGHKVSNQQSELDLRARSATGELVRPKGSLAVELYGPVDMDYWQGS